MTLEDAPAESVPPTRRALRATTGGVAQVAVDSPATSTAPSLPAAPVATSTAVPRPAALAWVDPQRVRALTFSPRSLELSSATAVAPDLLADLPRRSAVRPAVVVPFALILLVIAGYSVAALTWPLNAVPPQIAAVQVQPVAAPAAALSWPSTGSAAVGVAGIGAPVASATEAVPMASITKVVTALLVLDEMPLSVGEQGRKFSFGSNDRAIYQNFLANGESALNVPVGGTLTEYQLLEGMLIGSAGNYAEHLASSLWPTDAVYAAAAKAYLSEHGLKGITVVEPTGISRSNRAAPAALIPLAQKALANPVIAEIVAKTSVKLPGAGTVKNTNKLLADPGVVGVKTGSLDTYSLLSAKDVAIGDVTVRMYASTLEQKNDKQRLAESRALYAELEKELQPTVAVTAGTTAGSVTTAWGEQVDVVAAEDADVILWNGSAAAATIDLKLGDGSDKGDVVGTLTVTGPLNSATVDLKLADDVEGPDAWWRLTHPLELFGIGK